MALNYDITAIDQDVRSYVGEDGDRYMTPVTETLIWSCLSVKLGEITEKNWREFYARLQTWNLVVCHEPSSITPQDVKNHIGLKTNVYPDLTRTQWYKQVITPRMDSMVSEAERKIQEQQEVEDALKPVGWDKV